MRRHVDGGGERLGEALKAALVASGFGKLVKLALGVFDMALRRRVDRRVVGEIDHVLADGDQVAADRQVVDGAAVILGVDDGRRFGGKPRQILIDGQPGNVEVGRQERLERHRRRQLSGADQPAGKLEDALMDALEEMLRLEEIGNAIKRLVIDEDSAQQRLLGLDIVRRRAECRFRGKLLACSRIECCHGPDQGICMWPICGHSTSRITQRRRQLFEFATVALTNHEDLVDNRAGADGKCSLRLSPLHTVCRCGDG